MAPRQATGGSSWDELIPDTTDLYDRGYYNLVLEEPTIDDSARGKKQYRYTCRIVRPVEFEGQVYFARFVIGTDNDPGATDPETWKAFGGQRLKNFLVSCDAPRDIEVNTPAFDKMFIKLARSKVCVLLTQNTNKKKDSPYFGQLQQQDKWFKLGEREPGLLGDNGDAVPRARTRRPEPEDEPTPVRRGRTAEPNGADDDVLPPRRGRDEEPYEDDDRPRARRREARE